MSVTFCSSGRKIPQIGQNDDRPCGRILVEIGRTEKNLPVMVCRRCDGLPLKNERS